MEATAQLGPHVDADAAAEMLAAAWSAEAGGARARPAAGRYLGVERGAAGGWTAHVLLAAPPLTPPPSPPGGGGAGGVGRAAAGAAAGLEGRRRKLRLGTFETAAAAARAYDAVARALTGPGCPTNFPKPPPPQVRSVLRRPGIAAGRESRPGIVAGREPAGRVGPR